MFPKLILIQPNRDKLAAAVKRLESTANTTLDKLHQTPLKWLELDS